MPDFDFRDMLGGAGAQVQPDERLADGVERDEIAAALNAEAEKADTLANWMAQTLMTNCCVNGVSAAGVWGMVAMTVLQAYGKMQGDDGRAFALHAFREAVATMERGS